jgi:hypothetical protein
MTDSPTLPRVAREVTKKSRRGTNAYAKEFWEILSSDPEPGKRAGYEEYSYWSSRMYRHRERLVQKYAWAIPTSLAITRLVQLGALVEIGAGAGYWAHLISNAGGDIVAYDTYPPDQRTNMYCDKSRVTYHDVVIGGPEKAADHPDRALLLCWPPYQNSMASSSLKNYAGDTLIYIGEPQGGCTANQKFFSELTRSWKKVGQCTLPQWRYMHDELCIYQRIR